MVCQNQNLAGGLNLWLCTAFYGICGYVNCLLQYHFPAIFYSMSFQIVPSFPIPFPSVANMNPLLSADTLLELFVTVSLQNQQYRLLLDAGSDFDVSNPAFRFQSLRLQAPFRVLSTSLKNLSTHFTI